MFGDEFENVEHCSGGGCIERIASNGVDGDTSPNDIGLSMRGLFSDVQTGRSSIGGEYVVIVSGKVMPKSIN